MAELINICTILTSSHRRGLSPGGGEDYANIEHIGEKGESERQGYAHRLHHPQGWNACWWSDATEGDNVRVIRLARKKNDKHMNCAQWDNRSEGNIRMRATWETTSNSEKCANTLMIRKRRQRKEWNKSRGRRAHKAHNYHTHTHTLGIKQSCRSDNTTRQEDLPEKDVSIAN